MTIVKSSDLSTRYQDHRENRPAVKMDLSVVSYNSTEAQIDHLENADELLQYKADSRILWINIVGLEDAASIKRLGEIYGIHPLTIEDIVHTDQQPKIEIFEKYRYMSLKTIQQKARYYNAQGRQKRYTSLFKKKITLLENIDEFQIYQVSIIITQNILITFQETHCDLFDRIRKKILDNAGKIREKGTEYLSYTIIDSAADEYFFALNYLEEDIENYEDRATKTTDGAFIEEIQDTKKNLLLLKRAIFPLRENIVTIIRQERYQQFFQIEGLKPFVQDLCENLTHALTILDNHREWLTNIMEVNISVLSYQMNKIMKVLTTISTIFIPLTFIAGVYGMNFDNMPELRYEFGYFITLGIMGIIAISMTAFFRFHRW